MSLIPIRPPGLSTRAISVSTAALSAERLITQLEMTTSTEFAGQRDLFDLALEEDRVARCRPPRRSAARARASRRSCPGRRRCRSGRRAWPRGSRRCRRRSRGRAPSRPSRRSATAVGLPQPSDARIAASRQLAALFGVVESFAEARRGVALSVGAARPLAAARSRRFLRLRRGRTRRSAGAPPRAARQPSWSSAAHSFQVGDRRERVARRRGSARSRPTSLAARARAARPRSASSGGGETVGCESPRPARSVAGADRLARCGASRFTIFTRAGSASALNRVAVDSASSSLSEGAASGAAAGDQRQRAIHIVRRQCIEGCECVSSRSSSTLRLRLGAGCRG